MNGTMHQNRITCLSLSKWPALCRRSTKYFWFTTRVNILWQQEMRTKGKVGLYDSNRPIKLGIWNVGHEMWIVLLAEISSKVALLLRESLEKATRSPPTKRSRKTFLALWPSLLANQKIPRKSYAPITTLWRFITTVRVLVPCFCPIWHRVKSSALLHL